MGREVKRVDVNFDWPIGKVWKGFLNPYWKEREPCPACEGKGESPVCRKLTNQWYGNTSFKPEDRGSTPFEVTHPIIRARAEANVNRSPSFYGTNQHSVAAAILFESERLADLFNSRWMHHVNRDDVTALLLDNRLTDLTHTWSRENGWQPKVPPHIPTPEEVNNWSINFGLGHDSLNHWCVVQAECKRLGFDPMCSTCNGSGDWWTDKETETKYDKWSESEPPEGEGWQIWETVSEGSPVTPVFATDQELIDYLVEHGDLFDIQSGHGGWNREVANNFVSDGWAPTLVGGPDGIKRPRDGQ